MNPDVVYPLNKLTSTYQEINSDWLKENISFIRFFTKEEDSLFRCVIKSTTNQDPTDINLEKFRADINNFISEKGEKSGEEIIKHVEENLENYEESVLKNLKENKLKLLNTDKQNLLETYFTFDGKNAYPLLSKDYRNLKKDSRLFSVDNYSILDYYLTNRIKTKRIITGKIMPGIYNKIFDLLKEIKILSLVLNINFIILKVYDTGVFVTDIYEINKNFPYIVVFEQVDKIFECGGLLIKEEEIKLLFYYEQDKDFIDACKDNINNISIVQAQAVRKKEISEPEIVNEDYSIKNILSNIENSAAYNHSYFNDKSEEKIRYTKQEYLDNLNL